MGRWRAPAPGSAPYITASGYRRLEQELKQLWERRQDVTRALAAAAAEGDRSENAEYIYRKKELRSIDARIRYLQRRMPRLRVVTEVGNRERVFFGARVQIEDAQGTASAYRIVGADELDGSEDRISIDSPMARVLLGKSIDEEFSIRFGAHPGLYVITAISYGEADGDDDTQQ